MTRKLLVLFAILIPLVLVACGDDDSSDDSASSETTTTEETTTEASAGGGAGGTVEISASEFKFDPSDPTTGAGSVTFNLTNDGEAPHNLEVEGNGIEEVSDTVEPGQSTELSVDLEAGTYVIYCAIDGHRDQGMEGELTVQ